eukprot:9032-Pelagococcus_subviridis.AAC.3
MLHSSDPSGGCGFSPRKNRSNVAGASTSLSHSSRSSPPIFSLSLSALAMSFNTAMFSSTINFATYSDDISVALTSVSTCLLAPCAVSPPPKKASSPPPALNTGTDIGPTVGERPYSATALYARSVARWMSSIAPVDTLPQATISAARPPMRVTSRPRSSSENMSLRSSSPGGMYVYPSAPPLRATMDSASGRCVPGMKNPTAVPTTACPASCALTVTFSDGDRSERFFSMPATVRNTAFSNSSLPTIVAPFRPARSAASFTKFASSAPVNPAVICAMSSTRNAGSNGKRRFDMCTPRISLRPCLSGRSTDTRRVQRVRSVRRGEADDELAAVEPVELGEELIQRLLALVVAHPSHLPVAPPLRDGVDLVDEHDRRRLFPRALEHVPDPRRAHADVELDKLGRGDGDERHPGFSRDGSREERLPRPGRADE